MVESGRYRNEHELYREISFLPQVGEPFFTATITALENVGFSVRVDTLILEGRRPQTYATISGPHAKEIAVRLPYEPAYTALERLFSEREIVYFDPTPFDNWENDQERDTLRRMYLINCARQEYRTAQMYLQTFHYWEKILQEEKTFNTEYFYRQSERMKATKDRYYRHLQQFKDRIESYFEIADDGDFFTEDNLPGLIEGVIRRNILEQLESGSA